MTGVETYIYDFHPPVTMPVTYFLPDLAIPEPSGLSLMASGLALFILLGVLRTRPAC